MSNVLQSVEFSPELLDRESVQGFDCGPAPWEVEITQWLKSRPPSPGACGDLAAGNRVWLFVNDLAELVGVGSCGLARASWPKNSSPLRPATCLTWIGVDHRYRRKGYGQQILDHLLHHARQHAVDHPLIVLYVHADNTHATDWYKRNGFVPIGQPKVNDGHMRQRMVLNVGT